MGNRNIFTGFGFISLRTNGFERHHWIGIFSFLSVRLGIVILPWRWLALQDFYIWDLTKAIHKHLSVKLHHHVTESFSWLSWFWKLYSKFSKLALSTCYRDKLKKCDDWYENLNAKGVFGWLGLCVFYFYLTLLFLVNIVCSPGKADFSQEFVMRKTVSRTTVSVVPEQQLYTAAS